MALRAGALARTQAFSLRRVHALPLALAAVVLLLLPMFASRPAVLTSDESLYLAEAYSIAHGDGFAYPSGEPITHRAPLHPIVLAPAVRVAGTEGAYAVSRLVVAIDAVLVLFIAWRIGGALAGALAGCGAAASAYLNGLGTTLYLDPFQCMFMLAAFAALYEAARAAATERATIEQKRSFVWRGGAGHVDIGAGASAAAPPTRFHIDPTIRLMAAAGAAVGFAFLAKESAVQWAPLGVVAWLAVPALRTRVGALGALAYSLAFATTVAPWFAWVFIHTGDLYMVGSPGLGLVLMAVVVGCLAGAAALRTLRHFDDAAALQDAIRLRAGPHTASIAAGVVIVIWGAFMLWSLTRYSTWPYPNDYLQTVPRYLTTVAPQTQPFFVLAAAWIWIAVLACRHDQRARLIIASAALFAPFALFIANRNLQLRDVLPLVYVSYIGLGIAAADALRVVRRSLDDATTRAVVLGAMAIVAVAFTAHEALVFRSQNQRSAALATQPGAWDSDFARTIAGWMDDNLPPGSRVLASRLYFSSLYVETGGQFEIRQIPTVRVSMDRDSEQLIAPASNLFRWGDGDLRDAEPGDSWLYLHQFPGKRYWVGLSEEELLEYAREHETDYLVLTGEDIAFSTLSYAGYLTSHPAFTLVYHARATAADQLFVYAVDRTHLGPVRHSTAITPANLAALERESGLTAAEIQARLGTPLRVRDADRGLSAREEEAAIAGVDLGLP